MSSKLDVNFWERDNYPEAVDLVVIPFLAFVFSAVRFLLDRFVFERCGRAFITSKSHVKGKDDARVAAERTHAKFKESSWKCLYYCSACAFAFAVTYNEPWFKETKYFFSGPGSQVWPDLTVKRNLKALYLFAGSFYFYSIFALVFWETRRKDFTVSMTHHITTVVLIIGSYLGRFVRFTSMVIAIHDVSDVLLEAAKLCKYIDFELGASGFFLLFAISWAYMRLWIFPRRIIYSACYEVLHIVDKRLHPVSGPFVYYLFNSLLITLLIMHIYWWLLILRVIWKQVAALGVVEDVRSDDEDDDD
eukprot:TRINITY_DN2151_c0_g1_i1.p1 TRINITY_DN2151_c0_g1~~TRINITY_DN2151_c0_g1_i1.p1  ORF type:complete len:330 (+),score=28.71 TRINITY_DN2151_c0_g1_i1:79-990(+)